LETSSRDAVRIFKALSDITRVEIIKLLGKTPRNVTELTSLVGVSQPKVSRHLKILRDAGLLRDVRKGKWVWYELAASGKGDSTNAVVCAVSSLFSLRDLRRSSMKDRADARETVERALEGGLEAAVRIKSRGVRGVPEQASGVRLPALARTEKEGKSPEPRGQERARAATAKASETAAIRKSKSPRKAGAPVERERPLKKDIEDFLL